MRGEEKNVKDNIIKKVFHYYLLHILQKNCFVSNEEKTRFFLHLIADFSTCVFQQVVLSHSVLPID